MSSTIKPYPFFSLKNLTIPVSITQKLIDNEKINIQKYDFLNHSQGNYIKNEYKRYKFFGLDRKMGLLGLKNPAAGIPSGASREVLLEPVSCRGLEKNV
ncbi:MAG: hypothetical protein V2I46_07290 [Bacteroides sp.]|nr:hypothetical protein [Bacteroides sp.]